MNEQTELDPNDAETAYDEATETEAPPVTLLDLVAAPNIVPLIGEATATGIGSRALEEYQTDLATVDEFHQRYDRAMDIAMQVGKPKTFPWSGASNVIFPLLSVAAIQFQARAYPAIIDGENVVKCRVLGPDPDGAKADRAERVAAHMNWQFLNDIPGWEEDTDKLLLRLPIVGCIFRKTWFDPVEQRTHSETVSAKDFIVHMDTVSLARAPRWTHRQRYYPHEIEAFIRSETWVRVPYQGEDGSDPHSLVEIYEQFRLIDLDGDGMAEPYIVTFTDDGAVARIVACYDKDTMFLSGPDTKGQISAADAMGAAQEAQQAGDPGMMAQAEQMIGSLQVVRIAPKTYFTKYGFIPAPDGTFYDIGFGTLTDNLGAAVNTLINQLIDAGTLSNMQGGFVAGGTKIRGGNMRFTPGEWKRIDGATSGPLRDAIMPLQLPGPSPVLFQLLEMLIGAVKEITSVSDILSGNQESQTAPTTALALIEQGQKVFTAIYKRIHRALGVEIKAVATINRDHLNTEQYFALADMQGQAGPQDYEDKALDIQPMSDPTAINDRVKMAKAQVLQSFKGDPLVNQQEINKRVLEAADIPDTKALLDVPPAPPPPDLMAKAAQAIATANNQNAQAASNLLAAAQTAYALGTVIGDANIKSEAQRMLLDGMALADKVSQGLKEAGNGGEPTDGPGAVPAMEGMAPDGGVPPVPQGPAPDAGNGMG